MDIIIPSYRPGKKLEQLLYMLSKQTIKPEKIIVMNTERKYWDAFFKDRCPQEEFPGLEVHHISKEEFDHGRTRGEAVKKYSQSDIFVCMTQDAVPADEYLLQKLTEAFDQKEDIAAAYARQLADTDCGFIENYTRQFNYPEISLVKNKEDLPRLGIKTYFCSNVCAAYRRKIYDKTGGFVTKTIFNEDMFYAAEAVKAGYSIAYAADAKVIHSHNYGARQLFSRNFDLGVSHAERPDIFKEVPATGEGVSLVKKTAGYLFHTKPWLLPKLVWQSGFKFLGYQAGKHHDLLPMAIKKKWSMNPGYWK